MTEQEKTNAFREVLSKICNRKDFKQNNQNVHTPYKLCGEMLTKLNEFVLFTDKIILTFNLEFVEVLCYDCQVKKENIWFITDCPQKAKIIEHKRFNGVNVVCEDYLLWSETTSMKFDIIVGNPPYNAAREKCNGNTIWPDFVKKSLSLLKKDGYLCFVHPPAWRKPESDLWNDLSKKILYLSIQDKVTGQKVFGATTRFDWYVAKNSTNSTLIKVSGEDGKLNSINLNDWNWLPGNNFELIKSILAKDDEQKCELIQSTDYRTDKPWVSRKKQGKFKYPIFLSNNKDELRFCYSSKDLGHFGISKVICNGGEFIRPINDFEGKYGINAHSFGIKITSKEEGDEIIKALNSEKFQKIVNSTKWSNYQIDYRMFKHFKKEFWKDFI